MKAKKSEAALPRKNPAPSTIATAARKRGKATSPSRWPVFAVLAGALALVFWAYGPAMHGPFLFDDNILPFAMPSFAQPLRVWITGLRPLLMFSYWVNVQISGNDTFSYHLVNVLIHCAAAALIYFVVRRLLKWGGVEREVRTPLAGFCALLFLLHPVESEAVAYLAGRSEALSSMFVFAAFAVFLYRKEQSITWARAAAVILLFVAAVAAKEQTIVLPALLLLTDYWWNPGFSIRGIRDNWRLYAPLALGAAAGVARFLPLILHAETAGFGMKDLTWYQYLFTEFRAIFIYIREFFLPFGLNADWDFPISHSIFDRGAIVGMIVLLALMAAAWHWRRRFPLASYGFFAFLVLMLPTSSILPIRDPIAERRLYFASVGLLLVTADLVRRIKLPRATLTAACGAVLLLATLGTHARAETWSSELALWEDSTAKSPNKPRDHFQLATAYLNAGDCARALNEFEKTAQYPSVDYPRYNLLVDWGLALDCANQPEAALAKLREAAGLEQTAHVYTQIAMVEGKRQHWDQAMTALDRAIAIDPSFPSTYAYKGIIYVNTNRPADAVREYEHALALDPTLEPAKQGLMVARQRLAMQPRAAGARQ